MAEQNDIKTQQKRLDTIDQKEDREVLVGEKKYGDVIFGKVASLTRKIDTDAGITDERVKALPAFRKLKQDAMNTAHDELKNIDEKNIDATTKKLELTIRQLEVKFEKMKELTPLMDTFEKFQKMFGALPFLRDWMTLYTAIDPIKRAPPETMMKDMEKLMSIGGGYAPAGEMVKHMELDVVNLMGAYLRGDRATADMTIIVLSERLAFARRVTEHLPKIKEERKKIETSIREYESHNAALRTAISSGRPLQFMKGLEQSYLDGIKLMPALKSMTKWEKELMGATNSRVSVGYEKLLPDEVRKEVTFTTITIDGQGKPKDMPANIPLTQEAMVKTEEALQGQLMMIRRGIYLTTKDPAYKAYFEASQEKMTSRLIDDALQYMAESGGENPDIKKCMGIVAGNFDSIQRMQPENPIRAAQENSNFQKRILSLKKKLGVTGVDAHANTAGILGNEAQFFGTELINFSKLKEQSPKQYETFTNILNTYLQQSRALSGQMLTQNPIIGEFQHKSIDAKQMFSGLSTTFQTLSIKIEKTGDGFSKFDMEDIKKEIITFRSRASYKFLKSSQAMATLQEMKKHMSDPSLIRSKDMAMIKQTEQAILQSQMALQQIDQTCDQLLSIQGYGAGALDFTVDALKIMAKIAAGVAGAVTVSGMIAVTGGVGAGPVAFLLSNAMIAAGATAGSAIADSAMEQNMNALQKDELLKSWVRGTVMSAAAGVGGQFLGTGMGHLSAKTMQAMQNSRLGLVRTAGTNMEARALQQAMARQAQHHLSGNIFRNMMMETKEELLEEGLEATGRAIAPDDPSLGFALSLLGTAYGHGKRVEGGRVMQRNNNPTSTPPNSNASSHDHNANGNVTQAQENPFQEKGGKEINLVAPLEQLKRATDGDAADTFSVVTPEIYEQNIKILHDKGFDKNIMPHFASLGIISIGPTGLVIIQNGLQHEILPPLKHSFFKIFEIMATMSNGNFSVFQDLTGVLQNKELNIQDAACIIEARDLYKNDIIKFKEVISVVRIWTSDSFKEALTLVRQFKGESDAYSLLMRLSKLGSNVASDFIHAKVLYEASSSQFHSILQFTEHSLQQSPDLIRRQLTNLIHAKDAYLLVQKSYQNNPEMIREFIDIIATVQGADTIINRVLAHKNIYGTNPVMLRELIPVALRDTHSLLFIEYARSIYADNLQFYRGVLKVVSNSGDVEADMHYLNDAKRFYGKDPQLFDQFINLISHQTIAPSYSHSISISSYRLFIKVHERYQDRVLLTTLLHDANSGKLAAVTELIEEFGMSDQHLDAESYHFISLILDLEGARWTKSIITAFHQFRSLHEGKMNAHDMYLAFKKSALLIYSGDMIANADAIVSVFPEYEYSHGITRDNWMFALHAYATMPDGDMGSPDIIKKKADFKKLIDTSKNIFLEYLNEMRDKILASGSDSLTPMERSCIAGLSYGIPHYKILEDSVSFIAHVANLSMSNESRQKTASILAKFSYRDRGRDQNINFSHSEIASFYQKFKMLIGNTPLLDSLLSSFDALQLNGENFRLMQNQILQGYISITVVASDNLPAYKTRLDTISSDLLRQIESTSNPIQQKTILLESKKQLDALLAQTLDNELGLHNLPPMTPEILDHIVPHITYLSNIADVTPGKNAIISLFILLNTIGKWDAFKRGEALDLSSYLSGEHLKTVQSYLANRTTYDIFAGVDPAFFGKLNEKMEAVMVGESGGISDTIGGIERHLNDLSDNDNFSALEQKMLGILKKFGPKIVGRSLSERFRNPIYTDEVIVELGVLENEKELLPTIQKVTRILGSLLKFQESIDSLDLSTKLQNLENSIRPSNAVISVFQKIDVDMKSGSGAKPIGDDIEHLESLLNKHREKLSDEEFALASEYLSKVKQATMDLYAMKDTLTKEFMALQEASTKTKEMGDRLKSRLEGFRKLLMVDVGDKMITLRSTMTGNIEDVIGHIRQCLGCLTKEINNDTNLTFGDRNRFLLVTREFKMDPSQSISDQLVTILRTKEQGESEGRLSFVMDNVYGTRSPDILTVNVLTVLKKMKTLKKSTGTKQIDIFVTDAALLSCGLTQEHLEKKIREEFGTVSIRNTTKTVTVEPSAGGDGHYEIGGVFNGRVAPTEKPDGSLAATTGIVSGIAISL